MVRMWILGVTTGMLVPATLSGHPSVFSVTPEVTFLRLSSSFRTDPGLTYGVALELSLSRRTDTWISVQTARLFTPYDNLYGTTTATLGFNAALAGVRHTVTNPIAPIGLFLSAGVGIARFSAEARVIPAGGLGLIHIPARSDTRGIGTLSAGVNFRASQAIAFRLEPGFMVFTPLNTPQGSISVRGGIRVTLF